MKKVTFIGLLARSMAILYAFFLGGVPHNANYVVCAIKDNVPYYQYRKSPSL